jgi:hypothetical protein
LAFIGDVKIKFTSANRKYELPLSTPCLRLKYTATVTKPVNIAENNSLEPCLIVPDGINKTAIIEPRIIIPIKMYPIRASGLLARPQIIFFNCFLIR